jgi:hypothetical protein
MRTSAGRKLEFWFLLSKLNVPATSWEKLRIEHSHKQLPITELVHLPQVGTRSGRGHIAVECK